MTFSEYVQIREGLWLNDKNALPGMSRLNSLPTKTKSNKPKPLALKPTRPLARKPPTGLTSAAGYSGSPLAAGNVGSAFAGVPASRHS